MKKKTLTECMMAAVFRKAFRILLVDDEYSIRALAKAVFETLPIFEIDAVGSAREAEHCLNGGPYHLCFCDLGLTDCAGDQYYLVKKYGGRLPIIIMSGRASMEESAYCMSLGATWVFDKPVPLDRDFFLAVLNRFLAPSLFLFGADRYQHARYREVIDALIESKPGSVEEWARTINVNERYVRKICECCPLPLRDILNTVHLIDCALACGAAEKNCSQCGESRDRIHRCEKAMEFYCLHKRSIDCFLKIGNSASATSLKKA
ncbi:MAG: response regulator [Chitinispirillaceae bacterium]|nr:response regulator [Chitinispirillaceae bacterium]